MKLLQEYARDKRSVKGNQRRMRCMSSGLFVVILIWFSDIRSEAKYRIVIEPRWTPVLRSYAPLVLTLAEGLLLVPVRVLMYGNYFYPWFPFFQVRGIRVSIEFGRFSEWTECERVAAAWASMTFQLHNSGYNTKSLFGNHLGGAFQIHTSPLR